MGARLVSVSLFAIVISCLLYFQASGWYSQQRPWTASHAKSSVATPLRGRPNLWANLDSHESETLQQYLYSEQAGLNLTRSPVPGSRENVLQWFELLRPNKTDVLRFLDDETKAPPRFARVTINHGVSNPPEIREFMVGPLPVTNETQLLPLTYVHNSGRSYSVNIYGDLQQVMAWGGKFCKSIEDIVFDLVHCWPRVGMFPIPAKNESYCIVNAGGPAWDGDEAQVRWLGLSSLTDAWSLLPQGIYFRVNLAGNDSTKWYVDRVLYNEEMYDSVESFRKAWKSRAFEKLPWNADGDWTDLRPQQTQDPTGGEPPIMVQTGKSRVKVDRDENFISWLGFDFNIAFSPVTGISLFDVRIDGERLLYEIGLQEALAEYGGFDPKMSSTAYLDTFAGMGNLLVELVPGYDCPAYADFLDIQRTSHNKGAGERRTVCVFEAPLDYALQRHSGYGSTTTFANSMLVVRSTSTVGNYDYTFDYIFYLDGSIEVKVRASGFIQGAYGRNNTEYGYRVHDDVSSAIHDHTLNFKADFDIAGTKNRLETVAVREKNIVYPWSSTGARRTMVLEKSTIQNESNGAIDWPANGAIMYMISNNQSRNTHGESRGYRILPGSGMASPVHITTPKSSNLKNAATWAEHDMYVTQQKDTEPRSASPHNMYSPVDPIIQFDRFLDGGSLEDEDL